MKPIAWVALLAALVGGVAAAAAPSAEAAARGAHLYDRFCARCHGPGMVSPGTAAFDLRTFPLDQYERFTASVTRGKNDMPGWQEVLTAPEIEDVWAYLQTRAAR